MTTDAPARPAPSAVLPVERPDGLVLRRVDPDSDDLFGWRENVAIGFHEGTPLTPDRVGPVREVYRPQRLTGAYDGDVCVATFRSWDTTMTVPGGTVAADAISTVTVRPTHRRRGLLSGLVAADLTDAVDRGVPVAILIASEGQIYGRYGFGVATRTASWEVASGRARVRDEAPRGGRVDLVAEDVARRVAPAVFDAARRPGEIDRFPHWWDLGFGTKVLPGSSRGVHLAAVHTDADGTATGVLSYHVKEDWEGREIRTVLHVDGLFAATPQAYAELWRFLVGVDLVATVRADERAGDEPLPWLLTDGRAARVRAVHDFQWHRLLDPAAALSSRRYEHRGAVTFEVVDGAGWAAGTYTLETDDEGAGRCTAAPGADADVTLPVDVLSSVWLGGGDLRAAAWAGRADEHRDGGLDRLARLLATANPPYTGTWF